MLRKMHICESDTGTKCFQMTVDPIGWIGVWLGSKTRIKPAQLSQSWIQWDTWSRQYVVPCHSSSPQWNVVHCMKDWFIQSQVVEGFPFGTLHWDIEVNTLSHHRVFPINQSSLESLILLWFAFSRHLFYIYTPRSVLCLLIYFGNFIGCFPFQASPYHSNFLVRSQ